MLNAIHPARLVSHDDITLPWPLLPSMLEANEKHAVGWHLKWFTPAGTRSLLVVNIHETEPQLQQQNQSGLRTFTPFFLARELGSVFDPSSQLEERVQQKKQSGLQSFICLRGPHAYQRVATKLS